LPSARTTTERLWARMVLLEANLDASVTLFDRVACILIEWIDGEGEVN